MQYSEMLHHVALVGTDFLDEGIASIIRVIKIAEPGKTLKLLLLTLELMAACFGC
jgi:hypothetical protein